MLRRVMSRFLIFCRKFLFSQCRKTKKVRRETILCSRKILVSKIVRDKRRGKYHNFPSKFFCLTVPKFFVGESFSVSFISAIKKFWIGGGREYRDFRGSFCLTVTKIFFGGHFGVSEKFFLTKIFMPRRRGILVLSKFFVSQDQNEKLCKGIFRFSGSFLVSRKVYG